MNLSWPKFTVLIAEIYACWFVLLYGRYTFSAVREMHSFQRVAGGNWSYSVSSFAVAQVSIYLAAATMFVVLVSPLLLREEEGSELGL